MARANGVELWGGKNRQRSSKATFDAPLRWNEKPWVCDACGTARENSPILETDKPATCKCGQTDGRFHRRRVFSLSLGDWLDDAAPIEWLADMLDVIRRCPNLDFLLLTKRPEFWRDRIEKALIWSEGGDVNSKNWLAKHGDQFPVTELGDWLNEWTGGNPPANVWIGTTVENQEYADRIPELLKIPARVRFLSVEPMLEAIDLQYAAFNGTDSLQSIEGIHWVIVGGESGSGARPFNIERARSVVNQCKMAGLPVFVKQLGAYPVTDEATPDAWPIGTELVEGCLENLRLVKLKDRKGGDIFEWPMDLRVREFPSLSQPVS